jgi:hypothetical protein
MRMRPLNSLKLIVVVVKMIFSAGSMALRVQMPIAFGLFWVEISKVPYLLYYLVTIEITRIILIIIQAVQMLSVYGVLMIQKVSRVNLTAVKKK